MKNNKMYNLINISGGIVCIMSLILLFVFNNQKILIGVMFRGAFSPLILYNSIYVIFTNNPSFMITKGKEKHRKIFGVFLLLVGIFGLVTTLFGYGINGYPLLNWTNIFE